MYRQRPFQTLSRGFCHLLTTPFLNLVQRPINSCRDSGSGGDLRGRAHKPAFEVVGEIHPSHFRVLLPVGVNKKAVGGGLGPVEEAEFRNKRRSGAHSEDRSTPVVVVFQIVHGRFVGFIDAARAQHEEVEVGRF